MPQSMPYAGASLLLTLADLLLIVHMAFAAFIVLGLASIWLGRFLGWPFVRNRPFRLAHLAAVGIVALESLLGLLCPLTEWEDRLRVLGGGKGYGQTFAAYWLGRLLYHDWPPEAFLALYLALLAATILAYLLVPPRPRLRR